MRRRWTAAAATAAVLLGGCGQTAPDLFALHRTGTIPGADLTLVVNDSGRVRCNGGAARTLPGDELITARELERDIDADALHQRRFPPRPGRVLAYAVRTASGSVRWSDTSRPLPRRYFKLAFLARRIAQGPCGLAR
jgi:hypothetical protein